MSTIKEDGVSRSPFQPNNPVDPRYFVGRGQIVQNILALSEAAFRERRIRLVYVSGLKGIGKTSLAYYARIALEQKLETCGFHIFLGAGSGPKTFPEFMEKTLRGLIEAKNTEVALMTKIKQIFSHLIIEVKVGVVTIKQKELIEGAPKDASQVISFFEEFSRQLFQAKHKGFVLIFDEIDGVAPCQYFADFLKEVVDAAAVTGRQIALVVVLCGTRECFDEIRRNNSRSGELMDFIEVGLLRDVEVCEFFRMAFDATGRSVTAGGLDVLTHFSGGHPRVMHVIGETALLISPKSHAIEEREAFRCVNAAAQNWGKTHASHLPVLFDDGKYRKLFEYLCDTSIEYNFSRSKILRCIKSVPGRRVDELLHRLMELGVIERGLNRGDWRFVNRLASLYLHDIGLARGFCQASGKTSHFEERGRGEARGRPH